MLCSVFVRLSSKRFNIESMNLLVGAMYDCKYGRWLRRPCAHKSLCTGLAIVYTTIRIGFQRPTPSSIGSRLTYTYFDVFLTDRERLQRSMSPG